MQKIIKQFPVLSQYTYLNTATSGLLYDGLLDWRQEHDLDFLIGGSKMKMKSNVLLSETRNTIGKIFGCKSENIALVPNFSIGLNFLLEGMGGKRNVLLLEGDYPSVNWPFENRECSTYYLKVTDTLEENIYDRIKLDNINVLALSLVQWLNGIKVDLEFLKNLKKEFPDLLIIADGTQFMGTEIFNFEDSGIDVLGSSSYKWLLGGYGNGFMLFADDTPAKFSCRSTGFNAADGDVGGKDKMSFAKQFEPGHLDTFNFGSLNYSLGFLSDIGMENIAGQIKKLSLKAKMELENLGLLEDAVVKRKEHSSIFNISGDKDLFTKFLENDVVCAQRGNGIRLSFHFYNTENEIDKILGILKRR
ncbi:aminotransferase class V-fold PLP-dependent enzyme [Arenibacter sp. F20364]|uniref:aminotransferase class V-fold PLP-dependent enzyme n=1 Tax=Arenibacter sp. F20364 TaxID=2926415 RepID=UPI001FF6D292|nr:aminotransferase class V-fold PLP-dependent enzyme [Arenibacter sp. F20364]MCK0191250.1 aminotransferase class V-fold PLP-dependent enzyme [Arenibacter sp. F20364]